jgi:hypothetical protein
MFSHTRTSERTDFWKFSERAASAPALMAPADVPTMMGKGLRLGSSVARASSAIAFSTPT